MTGDNTGVGLHRFTQLNNPIDNHVQYTTWNNGAWTPFDIIGQGITTASQPSITAGGLTAQAVFQGFDNNHYYAAWNGGVWNPTAQDTGGDGTLPADITSLGANAVMIYHNSANSDRITIRERMGGVWGSQFQLSTFFKTTAAPEIITMTAGPQLAAMWPSSSANNAVRYSLRTNNMWSSSADIPMVSAAGRVNAVALPSGGIGLVYRASSNGKFRSTVYINGNWVNQVFLLPAQFDPLLTGTPAVAPGILPFLAEATFVADGIVYHTRFQQNLTWTVPVPVGGNGQVSVALARSN
jgi:hypothetical protein